MVPPRRYIRALLSAYPIRRYDGWTARRASTCPVYPFCNRQTGAGLELWGPTVAGTFCFPTDGRDLGAYRLPCTEVPTGSSPNRHPQILICRATQSRVRIVRHDDVAWLRM